MEDKTFTEGLIIKKNYKAPDFVICNMSFKVDEFTEFLKKHQSNGWVNVQAKMSKGGKPYAELDTWKPKEDAQPKAIEEEKEDDDLLPF